MQKNNACNFINQDLLQRYVELAKKYITLQSKLEDKFNPSEKYKTELCKKFQSTGFCPYGNKCRFAHGKEELITKIQNANYKKEKKDLKKYYDMQVEEKKKEEEFEKILDGEQARIWKKDCDKYNEDEKRIAKIIWDKNVRNLNTIKEQIRVKREKEKNSMGMSPIEMQMNREKLMKN